MSHQLPVTDVLFEKRFRVGFMIRHEIIDDREWGGNGNLLMKSAFNEVGDYIGDTRMAHRLCVKMGIRPERRGATSNCCTIGMSEHDGKWYGWSHRAICGFQTKRAAIRFAESVG